MTGLWPRAFIGLVLGTLLGVASVAVEESARRSGGWPPGALANAPAPTAKAPVAKTPDGNPDGAAAGDAGAAPTDGSGRPLRALFLGNSFLHANALPHLVAQFAARDGQAPFEFVLDAPPAFTLERHLESGRYQQHLGAARFDFVVLQEQSQRPSFERTQVDREMFAPARVLDSVAAQSHARTVLFMTWARRDGDPENAPGDDFDGMQTRIAASYRALAGELHALLAPVGLVWQRAQEQRPQLSLFMADGIHPTPAGSYLGAGVLYALLYDRPLSDIPFDAGLPPEDARFIRHLVDRLAEPLGIAGASRRPWTPGERAADAVVPGIVRPDGQGCPAGYFPVADLCYHRELNQARHARKSAIDAYRRGEAVPAISL